MSVGTRLALADATRIAQEIVRQLGPSCVRLAVAGSLRRGKADVGDIELVAIPRLREEPSSLWGDTREVSLLFERLAELEGRGSIERLMGGERYVKLRDTISGLQVDLFVTTPERWGIIYLIRTGPADYSQWLVTYARRQGFPVDGGEMFPVRSGLLARPETRPSSCRRTVS